MIWALMSSRNSVMCTALTDPNVPTGMKIGVSMVPWSVVMSPARAFEPWAVDMSLKSIKLSVRIQLLIDGVDIIKNLVATATILATGHEHRWQFLPGLKQLLFIGLDGCGSSHSSQLV